MTVRIRKSQSIGALAFGALAAAALLLPLGAQAQTHASLAKPAVSATSAKPGASRWTCMSKAMVEIAPVSFDTSGEATAWVRVYRVKGEIVAAERVDARQVEEL